MDTVTSPLTLDQAFTEYTAVFISARNLAAKTRVDYTIDVTQLLTFLRDRGITQVVQLDLSQLNGFLADMDTRELSGYTRRRKVSSIKSFCSFLESMGYVTKNPALRLIPPKRETTTPRVLTEGEYKRLQLAVANQPRDAAMIEVLLQTGIRLSEIAGLTLTDIEIPQKISKDAENVGSVLVRRGKGRKDRVIALNYKACRALRSYLHVRPRDIMTQGLFISKFKRSVIPRGIEWLVNKHFDEAGIQRGSVHSLRHTFGTHMVKRGTNLRVVQEAMGHKDLKTTSLYLGLTPTLTLARLQAMAVAFHTRMTAL